MCWAVKSFCQIQMLNVLSCGRREVLLPNEIAGMWSLGCKCSAVLLLNVLAAMIGGEKDGGSVLLSWHVQQTRKRHVTHSFQTQGFQSVRLFPERSSDNKSPAAALHCCMHTESSCTFFVGRGCQLTLCHVSVILQQQWCKLACLVCAA